MAGIATNPLQSFGASPTSADWLHSLLPPGGKVSVTVAHPTTGITNVANPSQTAGPAGPNNIPPGGAFQNHPGTPAPTAAPTPAAPHDTNPADGNWWNPYTGKQEAIPGVNAQGIITDPNAFWNYYSANKSGVLDALAAQMAKGGAANFQKPIDYNAIVTGDENYQQGLAGINLDRWNAALKYGDPSVFADMNLTPEQQQAISNNPNSVLAALRRTTTKANYDANSGIASHGAWSSGARNQAIENNTLDDIRGQAQLHDDALQQKQGYDQTQTTLFKSVKDSLEANGKFDSGDQEHNQAIFDATHKVITDTTKAANDLAHKHPSSIADAKNLVAAINAALKDHEKLFGPALSKQMRDRINYLNEVIRRGSGKGEPVIGKNAGVLNALKNSKLGGSLAGGPSGYTRP